MLSSLSWLLLLHVVIFIVVVVIVIFIVVVIVDVDVIVAINDYYWHRFLVVFTFISLSTGKISILSHFFPPSSGSSVQGKVQKYCILICNSAPYGLPSQYSIRYPGFSAENLVSKMAERGIHFSIFSPRRIPELNKLFHTRGVDKVKAIM